MQNSKIGRAIVIILYFCIVLAVPMLTLHAFLDQSQLTEMSNEYCQQITAVNGRTSYRQCDFPSSNSRLAEVNENDIHPFLQTQGQTFGIADAQNDLQFLEVKHGLASRHFRYQQVIDGIPVFGGYFSLHEDGNGRVHTIHSSYHAEPQFAQSRGQLSQGEAEDRVLQALGIMKLRSFGVESNPVWYPTANGTLIFAYQLTVLSEIPLGNFNIVVDAQTGLILFNENRIAFDEGHGYTFYPNPVQTDGDNTFFDDDNDATSTALDAERISVTLKGLNSGTGLLIGEFVDLATLNSPNLPDVDANEPSRNYFYDRDDPRFEQVMVYHIIDSVQRYIHSLGYDDDVGTLNGIRDYQTLANAHWQSDDWSYFDPLPGDNAIHFGDGDVDDAEDGDTIVHEYGHAIQHAQNSNWGGGHMGSMGEGFGDYIAASFFADVGDPTYQSSDAACVAEWDAYPCLRRVDNNQRYPDDLGGSVHSEGRIWSRALWDIRQAIGREAADTVILEHHFSLPFGSTMPDAALAVLQADADVYGSIHDAAIRAVFCDRGILSGATCSVVVDGHYVDVSPNQAKMANFGEIVTYTIQITNLGTVADSFSLGLSGNSWSSVLAPSVMALAVDEVGTAVVTVTIPNDALNGQTDAVTLTATSQGNNAQQDTAVLTTQATNGIPPVYGVSLSANSAITDEVMIIVDHPFTITNDGNLMDTFTLSLSGNSWSSVLNKTSVILPSGQSELITVSVTIPMSAADNDSDVATLTATSQGNGSETDTATATTTANVPAYGINVSGDQASSGAVGGLITYTIQLNNVGENDDTFDVGVAGNNWTTLPESNTIHLASGAQANFDVVVTILAGGDSLDTAVITFSSQGNNEVSNSVTLTTSRSIYSFLPMIIKP